MVLTVKQAMRRADLILEIQRAKAESDAATRALVSAIRERDNDNRFLAQCGIQAFE